MNRETRLSKIRPKAPSFHIPPAKARKKLGIPEPVCQFMVFPELGRPKKTRNPWMVVVLKTRPQMQRYLEHLRPERNFKGTMAFTDQKSRSIVFCLWTCTDNCVSHEMFHVVAWWANERRQSGYVSELANYLRWDHENHERSAEAHGNLVSQFWEKFTKAGFKREQCWGFERGK